MMPFETATELRHLLRGRDFTFYATRTVVGGTTVFEILVRLESDEEAHTLLPKLGMPKGCSARESRVWLLNCCLEALTWDAEIWCKSLKHDGGGMRFGDGQLLGRFEAELQEVRDARRQW